MISRLVLIVSIVAFPLITLGQDSDKELTKIAVMVFREFFKSQNADLFNKAYSDLEYFYCEGRGKKEVQSKDQLLEKSEVRERITFAFSEVDENTENGGLFAISVPKHLGSGWLAVSRKFPGQERWIDIWDEKYGLFPTPLDNAVKGTVSDFALRVDVRRTHEPEHWKQLANGKSASDVSSDLYVTMNRKYKNFYFENKEWKKVRVSAKKVADFSYKTSVKGECSTS